MTLYIVRIIIYVHGPQDSKKLIIAGDVTRAPTHAMATHSAQTNLARETLDALFKFGRTPQEVHYVSVVSEKGDREWYTIEELIDAAEYFDYDPFFTFHEVRDDMLIVGDGWWLKRSISGNRVEKWVQVKVPVMPERHGDKLVVASMNRESCERMRAEKEQLTSISN